MTGSPPAGIKVSLVNDANVHEWKVVMDGPENSPYAVCLSISSLPAVVEFKWLTLSFKGGKFTLTLLLPHEYPFKPPKISFKTRIYHPNVTFDEHGAMCIGILKPDVWKPSTKIMAVLTGVQSLIAEPVPDDAVETSAGEEFKNKRDEFNKKAREFTKKYASK